MRLWILVAILSTIGVAIVVRRGVALAKPPADDGLDAGFARHRILTAAHIAPGLHRAGPWQFVRSLRTRKPAVPVGPDHRWNRA